MPELSPAAALFDRSRARVTAVFAALLAAVLTVSGLVAMTSPALAAPGETGVIDGTVYLPDGSTPAPANQAQVTAYSYDDASGPQFPVQQGEASVDANGHWAFPSLPSGRYVFKVTAQVPGSLYFGGFTSGELSQVELSEDSYATIGDDETFTADFTMVEGTTVSGRLLTSALLPVDGAEVVLWRFYDGGEFGEGGYTDFATHSSDEVGDWSFDAPPGTYTLEFRAPSGSGLVSEFWDDRFVASPDGADFFDLFSGEPFIANAQLGKPGKVTGVVKSSAGTGIANVTVQAYADDGFDFWAPVGDPATTAANGSYTLNLGPGTYRVGFDGSLATPSYLARYWPNATAVETATSFTLGAGATKPNVNMVLTRASTLRGVVFPAEVREDISVSVCQVSGFCDDSSDFGSVVYDPISGAYSLGGLAAGRYLVHVAYDGPLNYKDEWFDNKAQMHEATSITVGAAATVAKNVTLDPGAQISGTIRSGGNGVAGITVGAFPTYSGYTDDTPARTALTDADGTYTLRGLPAGDFSVRTIEADGYADRWHHNEYSAIRADVLHLQNDSHPTGVDIDLEDGATLFGTVTAADDGHPLEMIGVEVFRFDVSSGTYGEWLWNDTAYTDSDGHYEITNLPPGQYALSTEGDGQYLGAIHGAAPGVKNPAEGARVDLSSGGDLEVSMQLQRGGAYTGRVVDESGNPVSDVSIAATDLFGGSAYTDENGEYTIAGLREGTHTLRYDASALDGFTWYTDYAAPAVGYNALPTVLPDITIETGSTISGVVRNAAGAGYAGVDIRAYTVGAGGTLEWIAGTESAAGGAFSIGGLPTDSIYLEFRAPSTSYARQFLGGSPVWALSDAVVFATPGSAKVDARLVTGGAITGVVKNKATGRIIAGAHVGASQTDPSTGQLTSYRSGTTNTKGAYVIPGLDAGGYEVSFNDYGTGPGLPFSDAHTVVTVPATGTVAANASLIPDSRVSGVIKRNATNQPVEGAYIVAQSATGEYVTGWSTETGAYSLSLGVGVWTVRVSDPTHQSAAAYLKTGSPTGTPVLTDATKITVTGTGAAFAGRNVNLPAGTASLTADIRSDVEADPSGSFVLERVDPSDESIVLSREEYLVPRYATPLNTLFPIENLEPGTYRFEIFGQSGLADGGIYPTYVSSTFEVSGASDAGEFNIGTPSELYHYDEPTILPGQEPELTGDPTIGGAGLFVSSGTWSRTPNQYFYQWTRNGKPIQGAVTQHYTLRPGDAGATIAVQVGASDFDISVFEEPPFAFTATVPGVIAPGAAADPLFGQSISGKPYVGQVLTANRGEWTLPGLSFSYQWYRGSDPIPGATAATYKAVVADVGAVLGVDITATRTGFLPATAPRATTEVIQPAVALKATKLPVKSGTGSPWSVSNGTWSPAATSISYEWRRYDSVTGEFSVVGTAQTQDAAGLGDSRITVVVTASRPGYTSTRVEIPVRSGPAPVFAVEPTVTTTTPAVGLHVLVEPVEANPPTGLVVDGGAISKVAYQWFRGTTAIAGATKPGYTPVAADLNKLLKVRVTLTAAGYTGSAVRTIEVGTVGAAAVPQNVAPASIVGDPAVGRPLKLHLGGWSPQPTSYTYQWKRGGANIPKATLATYTPTAADIGSELTVVISGRLGTQTGTATLSAGVIAAKPVTNVTRPALPATAQVGAKVTVTNGTWDLAPTSYLYQWWINDQPITGATTASYIPKVGDLGEDLSVTVTARRTGFANSDPTATIAVTVTPGAATKATKAPVLTVSKKVVTTVKAGQTVAAALAVWPSGPLSVESEWQVRSAPDQPWTTLPVENVGSYLVGVPAGSQLRVVSTATRSGHLQGVSASPILTVVP